MTFAQFIGNSSTGLIGTLNIVVIPFIIALAFFFFVWGVIRYFFLDNKGDEGKLKEGREFILWGIVGLVLIFSIWGLVNIALSTLGIAPAA